MTMLPVALCCGYNNADLTLCAYSFVCPVCFLLKAFKKKPDHKAEKP